MWITTVGRKPILCRPETNAEGGVRSSSLWGREKRPGSGWWAVERTRRRLAVHIKQSRGGELSESPMSSTYIVCQTSRSNRKIRHQYKWQKKGDNEVRDIR
jgi:hypothetical protein